MAIPKSFFVFLILALQLSCIGSLVHALLASQHPDSGPDAMVIPHQFLVGLAENYTLDSHWQRIGTELNITRYYKNLDCYYIDFSNDDITHDLSEESTLALIRSDPNVDRVSPNEIFLMDTDVTDHIFYGSREENEARMARLDIRVVKKYGVPVNSTILDDK